MSNFEFPTNIRQIGNVNDGLRIYVEDYVCSFLQQYAQLGGYDEKLAVLVGRYLTIDTQPVLFISGAIQGKFSIEEDGIMVFTDKTREYIAEQMDKYFPSLEVVGWMQSQPSYGTYLNPQYQSYHLENFKKSYQVLFVTDPIERLNSFYILDEKSEELKEAKGYFIYYEKNKSMHEYMLDNKVSDVKVQENIDLKDKNNREEKRLEEILLPKNRGAVRVTRRPSTERDIIKRQSVRNRKTSAEQKRTVNMLTSLCSVMVLVCFIMGAGLIRSEERIAQLEENLVTLNTAYRNILASLQQTENVFAEMAAESTENETPPAVVLVEDGNILLEEARNPENDFSEIIETAAIAQENDTQEQPPAESTPSQEAADSSIPDTYIVQQGDSLSAISQRFYGNIDMVEKIMEVNNMDNPDKIYFGKILILP